MRDPCHEWHEDHWHVRLTGTDGTQHWMTEGFCPDPACGAKLYANGTETPMVERVTPAEVQATRLWRNLSRLAACGESGYLWDDPDPQAGCEDLFGLCSAGLADNKPVDEDGRAWRFWITEQARTILTALQQAGRGGEAAADVLAALMKRTHELSAEDIPIAAFADGNPQRERREGYMEGKSRCLSVMRGSIAGMQSTYAAVSAAPAAPNTREVPAEPGPSADLRADLQVERTRADQAEQLAKRWEFYCRNAELLAQERREQADYAEQLVAQHDSQRKLAECRAEEANGLLDALEQHDITSVTRSMRSGYEFSEYLAGKGATFMAKAPTLREVARALLAGCETEVPQ